MENYTTGGAAAKAITEIPDFGEIAYLRQEGLATDIDVLRASDFSDEYDIWLEGRGEEPTPENAAQFISELEEALEKYNITD